MAQDLPEELLYDIFLHALPSNLLLTTEGSWNEPRRISPLNFSLVCRSWRTLALSRPNLWSEIRVSNEVGPRMDYLDDVDWSMLNKWLSRSSPTLLQIHIDIGDPSGHLAEAILPIFAQESHRWTSFNLRADTGIRIAPPNLKAITLRCSPPLSSLSLRLHDYGLDPLVYVDLSQILGDKCSRLEYLNVDVGAAVRLPLCHDSFHLPHLRSFHFTNVRRSQDLEYLRRILSASPNLEDLIITVMAKSTSPPPNRGAIRLPRLHSLTITTSRRSTSNYLFNVLICPSLSRLASRIHERVGMEAGEERVFLEPRRIHDLLIRSGSDSRLESLELAWVDGWRIDWGDEVPDYTPLKDLLFSLQNLKTLELRTTTLRRAVFEMLSVPPEAPDDQTSYPCPDLSEIQLCHRPPDVDRDFSGMRMEEMIVSRWNAGNLRAVTLQFPRPHSGELKKRKCIVNCIEEGLTVTEKNFYSFM